RKIPESPWGSPIPIGDGDGDVKRFPDGDGGGNGYSQKDKNKAKTDKTEHGIGKSAKNQSRRHIHLLRTNPGPLNGSGQPIS
ncbi:hypothetical protein Tco_1141143, partial [Tanacetum coccineum]